MRQVLGLSIPISTHALREEGDVHDLYAFAFQGDFYPRPPRGGRRKGHDSALVLPQISTHALREEGDGALRQVAAAYTEFLPTPSARRATEGSRFRCRVVQFLPTPSARRATCTHMLDATTIAKFLPTPSARRATSIRSMDSPSSSLFLPTPSARRATGIPIQNDIDAIDFYPRPPRGGRRAGHCPQAACTTISTHALREEGD